MYLPTKQTERRSAGYSYANRFTFQFSLQDTEALEWFEAQPHKGAYLKALILADKARREQEGGDLPLVTRDDRLDALWEERFALVEEFYREFGRFPNRNEHYRGTNLGRWLDGQKRKCKTNGDTERAEKLRAIGALDGRWDQFFRLTLAYSAEFGKLPESNTVYRGMKVGKWLETQVKQINVTDHSEHAEKLRAIGALSAKWDTQYALVEEFCAETGRLPGPWERYKDAPIGRWLDYQKRMLDPVAHPDRAQKLRLLGIVPDKTHYD